MDQVMQAALAIEGASAGMSLEWDLRGDPRALWEIVPALASEDAVIGVGAPLLAAMGAVLPGLEAFQALRVGRYTMPATQHALWVFVPGTDPGSVFEVAEQFARRLAPHARLAEATSLFSYRQGRDLTGFRDGSANPTGDAAWEAALVPEGDWQGGSFALVQRWVHFRARFAGLPQPQRDDVIGRRESDDEELANAPASAHIKRTEQEDFDPPAFLLRRSMPWGDARRHGLQFVAYGAELSRAQRMLQRMIGATDGLADALLAHTQAETGAFYFVPPVESERLLLPPVPVAQAGAGPATQDAVEVAESAGIRLRVDGSKCIHSRNCVLARPDVFVPNVRGAWLHPERASAAEVAAIAENCPSGAIQYERLDGGPQELPPPRNEVRLRLDGPLAIHGDFTVAGLPVLRATLCRCGRSGRKPFCDGSHAASGFHAPGEAPALGEPPAPDSAVSGPVAIRPLADGPLLVHGAVDLVGASGAPISSAPNPALCRCGQSGNKPFCDGSHARAGFRADD